MDEQQGLGDIGVWGMAAITGILGIAGTGPFAWIAGGITITMMIHQQDKNFLPEMFGYAISLPDRTRSGARQLIDATQQAKQRFVEGEIVTIAEPEQDKRNLKVQSVQGGGAVNMAARYPSWQEWLPIINNDPDLVPHLLVVGINGTGKTVLAKALIRQRQGKIIIIDPKPGTDWGLPHHTTVDADDEQAEFLPIVAAIDCVWNELRRRKHNDDREELTVIIDEFAWLNEVESVREPLARLFKRAMRTAREYRIRLVVLSQSFNVKTTNLDGEGATKDNGCLIRLGEYAADKMPELAGDERPACLEFRRKIRPVSLNGLLALTDEPIDPARQWMPNVSRVSAETESDLLASLLEQTNDKNENGLPIVSSVSSSFKAKTDINRTVCETGFETNETDDETIETEPKFLTPATIRQMYDHFGGKEKRGAWSRTREWIVKNFKIRNQAKAAQLIKEAIEEPPEQFRWLLDDNEEAGR